MNTPELRKRLEEGGAALFDLGNRLKFRLTGSDRVRYLNGQVSQNVQRIASSRDGAAHPGCVMNAKGKMNALVWISADADALYLDAEASTEEYHEELAMRLERYIISDDAELTDCTGELGLWHLFWGQTGRPEWLAAWLETLPPEIRLLKATRYGREGLDLCGPRALVEGLNPAPEMVRVSEATEEVFRIEQGVPRWGAELTEATLPDEAGLAESAIDYHKGCYIGQEVISRIKSVGRVNRHLVGFVSDRQLEPGAKLHLSPESVAAGEREVATITSSAWSFTLDKGVALGYLRRGTERSHLFHGPERVEVRTLPFV
ncbi:MAG TPA: glycine cleavage T C-terminal barrel domain-containing protein [Chthoniobacteraceae bacterium]|nr:glycine cleavage T C-terminal barrel domain-containing protein [Chthoniobacteraceae bacterium]